MQCTLVVRKLRLLRRRQHSTICGAEDEAREAFATRLCMAASQTRSFQGEAEADNRWRAKKAGRRLRLGIILPHGRGTVSLL
jgi:hypothetical protein